MIYGLGHVNGTTKYYQTGPSFVYPWMVRGKVQRNSPHTYRQVSGFLNGSVVPPFPH